MDKVDRFDTFMCWYLRNCTVFWDKWPVHDHVLVIPPSLLAIQDHAQINLEEQL